jgi:hypothetical protein
MDNIGVSTKFPAYRQAGKHQITNKFQYPKFKISNEILWVIRDWDLELVWNL